MSVPLFVPQPTNDDTVTGASKTLLMTHHGWGKTTTCAYYQQAYGRGLIVRLKITYLATWLSGAIVGL